MVVERSKLRHERLRITARLSKDLLNRYKENTRIDSEVGVSVPDDVHAVGLLIRPQTPLVADNQKALSNRPRLFTLSALDLQ